MTFLVPGAVWRPVVNRTTGTPSSPGCANKGLVLHVVVGNGSPFSLFNTASRQASSTWWVSKTGVIEQYVDPDVDRAWAQGAGNRTYHSVETEGFPSEPLTDAQVKALGHIFAVGHTRYGWPLHVSANANDPGLLCHYMGSGTGGWPDLGWGAHTCPDSTPGAGPRSGQRAAIIAAAQAELGATQPSSTVAPAGELTMAQIDDILTALAHIAQQMSASNQAMGDVQNKANNAAVQATQVLSELRDLRADFDAFKAAQTSKAGA